MKIYGPVELSVTLRNFLCYALSNASEEKDLGHAVDLFKSKTTTEINEGLSGYNDHKPVDIKSLRQELANLTCAWTKFYDIETLLELNGTGLKTHMHADEVEKHCGFEIEGPIGDGGNGVRKQWKRIGNPLDKRVLAIVTYAYDGTRGDTDVFEKDFIVRPHSGGPRRDGHVGGRILTPEEVVDQKQRWTDYCAASDAISERIAGHIFDVDEKNNVMTYSAYKSDDRGVPIDNLDEVAVEGNIIITQLSDYKGEDDYDDYESEIVENPTWLDICVLFNRAVEQTGDFHHIFLEGLCKTKKEKDGVPIYRFSTGS